MSIRLSTKLLLGVLLVILGMTAMTVYLGGRFVGDEVLRKTIADMERTRILADRFEDQIHASLSRVNDVLSELPNVKGAAGTRDALTVAKTLAEIVHHTDAEVLFWLEPGQVGAKGEVQDGGRLAVILDKREDPPVAFVLPPEGGAASPGGGGDLFSFNAPGETGPEPLPEWLPGTGIRWKVQPLAPGLRNEALVARLLQENARKANEYVWSNADPEVIRGEQLTATFRERIFQVSYKPFGYAEGNLQYLGILMAGKEVSGPLARQIAEATGTQVTFVRLDPARGPQVVGTSEAEEIGGRLRCAHYARRLVDGRLVAGGAAQEISFEGRDYVVKAEVMGTTQGSEPGITFIEGDLTAGLGSLLTDLRRGLLGVSLLGAVLALMLISQAMRVWVNRPVAKLVSGMERIETGDLDTHIDISSRDEMGELADAYNRMLLELQKKEQYMRMVSKSAVTAVESQVTANLAAGGERRTMTVLFSDIRGFTTLCERIDPNELVTILNRYFDAMVEIIYRHGGQLDKFIGDAIMAMFESDGHPRNAVLAAVEMQAEVARLDREEGLGLKIGVGLHTGDVISGFIGAKEFMNHTILGDAVNVAARLESESKNGRHTAVLISQETYDAVEGLVEVEKLAKEHVKGKTQQVNMYEVVRVVEDEDLYGRLDTEDPAARAKAVRLLGKVGGRDVIPLLVQELDHPDERVALEALGALRVHPFSTDRSMDVAEQLVARIAEEQRASVRTTLVSTLGWVGHHGVIPAVLEYLKDDDARMRANAIEALQRLASEGTRRVVRPLLDDENNRVMANAAVALFETDPETVKSVLAENLRDPSPFRRASACYSVWIVASRYPAELLDAQKAKDLDRRGALIHRIFRELAGILSARLTQETDPMVLRNLVPALEALMGAETVRPLIEEVRRTAHDRGDPDVSDAFDTSFPGLVLGEKPAAPQVDEPGKGEAPADE